MKVNKTVFNRHEIFTPEILDFHMDTIRDVEMIRFKNRNIGDGDKEYFMKIINKLSGIYDGVLYHDLFELSKKLTLKARMRIYGTIAFIEQEIKNKDKHIEGYQITVERYSDDVATYSERFSDYGEDD
tara:strand:- start:405 stop:788 length:384 start_codon:yes stop_codon:yes gene_type:complete